MNSKKHRFENYRKFLLNRVTASSHIIDYIENCMASEDEAAPHSFHKIMIHNWTEGDRDLFETLGEYFSPSFIPVNYMSQGDITSFYTSSLNLVSKITKLDFMFPHHRNMFNIDILFNDKSSADCFENRVTIEDIVSGVVSSRLNDKLELDLSSFCKDQDFINKKIHFYKINLLSLFKILMIRIGRDTRKLNLSNNNLSQIPVDILNFFIKGDLIAINLSNNFIPTMAELQRVSSKIEYLWIEGNPLCDELDSMEYVKSIVKKFPRLIELDGVRINEHGIILPFFRNYLVTPNKKTRMVVERFLALFYAHYDEYPRKKISKFYDNNIWLTICSNFSDKATLEQYVNYSRNLLNKPDLKKKTKQKIYKSRNTVLGIFMQFPETLHDPSSFTVDVLKHEKNSLILVVDGIYKEIYNKIDTPDQYFQFRRTFVFHIAHSVNHVTSEYFITNEMFSVSLATEEQIKNSFKDPSMSTNPMALKSPDTEDIDSLSNVFTHLTHLKKSEAEMRLKMHNWDITKALKSFIKDFQGDAIPFDRFIEEDDLSDLSSVSSVEEPVDMDLD